MVDLERKKAVDDVVFVRKPLAVAIPALKAFPWDSEHALVVLGLNEL